MELVAGVLIAQFESIMVASGYVPVEPAEDAFVVVDQRLATELGKQAVAEIQLCPGFVDDEAAVLVDLRGLAPIRRRAGRESDGEVVTFVVHREACAVVDKACRLFSFIPGKEDAVAILGPWTYLDIHGEGVLLSIVFFCFFGTNLAGAPKDKPGKYANKFLHTIYF